MNFYIGNSIDGIKNNDYNVEFDDELLEFVYSLRKQIPFSTNPIFAIDPYSDVEIPIEDIAEIIELCNYFLDSKLLEEYEEAVLTLKNLIGLGVKAMNEGKKMLSIGD